MEYNSFESALENLKKIVQDFETSDSLSLDQLLENYEEGMKAYSYCAKKLEDTQRKIKVIDETFK
ncbi:MULTISPECIES: exodeoxyribonuclease VII small subunit [unclassified Sedimentibacter]|uniref:exodeoxyribonuclease VII small subunit n=1 Tax=unclassified Sedimentibacter TaxID=2649220 RepID=UPI0027DFD5FA|nr:exodeoxyribonuclease VII small subunit [Sedimentibacter sp. MB35-C1]WMJ76235.1 exodeoxyribonuclease VII small subunit [Sedimentibacter sp. MB35-C1]